MFETLVASTRERGRPLHFSLLSVACHAALLLAAIVLTRGALEATPAALNDPWIFKMPVKTSDAGVPPAAAPTGLAPARSVAPAVAPISVVVGIPPIELSATVGPGLEDVLPMPDHDPITPHRAPFGPPRKTPHQEYEVDEPVRRLSGPTPVYPAALRAAGVEGMVTLRMVVDTLGRVAPRSLEVVQSSHPAFEAAASEAIRQSRFVAARFRGMAVRQLVQQSVRFAIEQ